MSISQPAIATNEINNHFPEQRVQTIADTLGLYLKMSFCDSIVRHSGQSLEELAAQSQAMEDTALPVSYNEKGRYSKGQTNKNQRSQISKDLGWQTCSSVHQSLLETFLG